MQIVKGLAYCLVFSSALASAHGIASPPPVEQWSAAGIPSLTPEQWLQDVQYFAKEIRTKPRNPYHLIAKARLDAEVAALQARIPSMRNFEVVVGLQRLAASIGDGHTFVDTSKLYRTLPIEAFWFGNDLRVVRAAPAYMKAIGARIVQAGSTPIGEVNRLLQQLTPQGENQWYVMDRSAWLITQLEPLAALHIIPYADTAAVTFETDSGSRFTLQIQADPPGKSSALVWGSGPAPLPFQHPQARLWLG